MRSWVVESAGDFRIERRFVELPGHFKFSASEAADPGLTGVFLDHAQPRHRFVAPGDDDFLATLDSSDQLGKLGFGLLDGDLHDEGKLAKLVRRSNGNLWSVDEGPGGRFAPLRLPRGFSVSLQVLT